MRSVVASAVTFGALMARIPIGRGQSGFVFYRRYNTEQAGSTLKDYRSLLARDLPLSDDCRFEY